MTVTTKVRREVFTVAECAKAWKSSLNTVYGMTYDGTLEPLRIGRSVRITRQSIEAAGLPVPQIEAA
ncbi:helix-turn-helix domain-containing protein [Pseudoclavibacter helvolus]|uniref:helix-turn-helix domain-containing protein n=1 Tax=Pseudoclavibacter helvolus TaxID=255205 RepID=UPI0024ACDA21|nr:helix-turn-helix domain-containing protein [Pseudoclavibacter helvolus]